MTLSELSIRRHVLAVMVSVVLVLFGLIAYQEIGTDRIPNIDFPVVNVVTPMQGADPEIIDASVTNEIERAVNTVPGIDNIQSSSVPGVSVVNVTFDLNKDVDVAFNEVQAKVSEIVQDLPEDAETPVVDKVEFDAQPIMWLTLQGDRTIQDLNRYARNEIRPRLENIEGVGEVRLGGRRDRTIRVELDPERLAAMNVAVPQVLDAIDSEHLQLPGGFLVGGENEELIKLDMEYHHPQELARLIIAYRDGSLIRLEDVGEVVDGLEDKRSLARFNREPAAGIGIVKVSGTDTVEIIEEVQRRVETEIRPQLEPGMRISTAFDESVFILEQIDALNLTILLGILFAGLVMWLFLKNLRSTLIIALSIPISLMAAVAVIYFFGYTLNSITMLAMLLLIGVVVDDAIVVLENIYRHREHYGEGRIQGAISGSNEVFFAVVASTLALVSIFASVIFMEAIIGRFFESFAVVVTFGVLASSLVALTLIPMLSSRFLRVQTEHGQVYWVLDRGFRHMEAGYRWLLGKALRWRWSVLGLAGLFLISVFIAFQNVGGEFAPEEDTGQFSVVFSTPLGSNIDYTDSRMQEIEKALETDEAVRSFFAAIGLGDEGQANSGIAFVRLHPREERADSQQDVMARLQPQLSGIPGVRAFASEVPLVGGQRGEPLQFVVQGPDLHQVGEHAEAIHQRLEQTVGMGRLDLDLDLELPELLLRVDRDRAHAMGLRTRDVARTANVLMGGIDVARYNDLPGDGQRYDLRVKGREDQFTAPGDLQRIFLRNGEGEMVRMDTVAHLEQSVGPASVDRYNMTYAAHFYGTPEVPLAEAVDMVRAAGDEVLPLGYNLSFTGQAEEMERAVGAMLFVLFLAVSLVYIVLSSQFNSFIQPLIIMAAQPLALVGGIFGLWIGGFTLNIFSMIGLVLLMGLVTKNGILLVDLTNQYREKRGLTVNEALAEACPIRLRPVLMTSLTLILALLPAVIGLGAGAETNAPMAAALIGGMVTATLLTLVVIPAAYSLVENAMVRRGIRRDGLEEA